ncbi:amidohydrolase family protein [Metabacillus halosaccharovorans]|uniref:Amidohydrolase family protein n=1 Tax=Metabacillus halosaccharovorans TaxID=930124 RepID=A0ABT3DPH2_9BACI|nr:amidohydrolase family protein [Metabacillus halosaccharovorans]MCV9888971.1 amidohydrolase family protein [Metabacillus halosaccharovorans]
MPLWDAVMMATKTPADILYLKNKGRISKEADADLVLLEEYYNVTWTMIGGKVIVRLKHILYIILKLVS